MNKTININLGGIFFHIDESAYLKLKRYLDAVRVSLSDDPKGQEEIMTDIEARIGELLSQKIKDARQVINENDINEIVEIMGKPEDYAVEEEESAYSGPTYTERKSKKLYRDADDKFLGGVSSGMAHYFNIDVIWVRLAWLIAAFGFGFGFIVYPILWILLPQAKTTAEKLEMMGEPVTIANIEKKIKEELGDSAERIKNGINEAGERIKNADYQKYGNKARSGLHEFIDVIGRIFSGIFLVIGKFIGIILIIISVGLIVALLISLFTVGSMDFFHEGWFFQQSMLYNSSGLPLWAISLIVFILIGIPLFFLFLLGLRILSGDAKTLGRTGKLSLLGIWLIALLTGIFFGTKQFMQTAFEGVVNVEKDLNVVAQDTLTIKFTAREGYGDSDDYSNPWDYSVITDQSGKERIYSENTRLSIHYTDNPRAYIKIRKKSKGDSRENANTQAENILYNFAVDSSSVALDTYFLTEIAQKYKEQNVRIDLYLPENQIVYFEKMPVNMIFDVDNYEGIYDNMSNHHFVMTKESMKCLDCPQEWTDEHSEKSDPESVNLQINKDGVNIEVVDNKEGKATVKIDETGIKIEGNKDSLK